MTKKGARITLSIHVLIGAVLWAFGFFQDGCPLDWQPVCVIMMSLLVLAIWGRE